jgi:DNA-binding transcriptional regulator PaaX
MTPMEILTEWHASWRIIQGTIICKTCHAEQLECDRENAFAHGLGCSKASLNIHPGQALDDVQKAFSRG